MNIQKFTQKSMEAIEDAQKLAVDYGNQEITQEHLLLALMQQDGGLIPMLFQKMEIDVNYFTNDATMMVQNLPKVSGNGQNYVGKGLNDVLIHAEAAGLKNVLVTGSNQPSILDRIDHDYEIGVRAQQLGVEPGGRRTTEALLAKLMIELAVRLRGSGWATYLPRSIASLKCVTRRPVSS